jgi:peptide/nickel transport system permease protein
MVESQDSNTKSGITGQSMGRQYTPFQDFWYRLRQHKLAMVGLCIISVLILMAIFAQVISPYDPVKINPRDAYQPPSQNYLMGTDEFGRDLLSRVIYGSRVSLSVGIISVSISLLLGSILGLLAGYYMGVVDIIIIRIMDILISFPVILLALVFIALLGNGIDRVMVAIGLVYTPLFARLARASVLAERGKLYVEGAVMSGSKGFRIIRKHILPNIMAPLIVQASLAMSYAILAEAALSFLGFGTQPPTPSWGIMLSKGRDLINHSPWISIWPGLAIMLVVFGFNVLGDGMRDALDPRLK